MDVIIYTTTSPQKKIYKQLDNAHTISNVHFKDDENVVNPVLIFTYSSNLDVNVGGIDRYNYAYIQQLHRYYWITSIEVLKGGMCALYLKCDVLMTYKPDLANTDLMISKKSSGSGLLPDKELPLYPYQALKVIKFDKDPFFDNFTDSTPCYVLNVAGK